MIHNICHEVCYTSRKIYQYIEKKIYSFNITPEQFIVLKTLNKQDAISQKELSTKLDKDQNTVKAIVDKLERKELVKRVKNDIDRRAFYLFITDKAKETIKIVEQYEKEALNNMLQNIDEDEIKILDNILTKIRNNIKSQHQ